MNPIKPMTEGLLTQFRYAEDAALTKGNCENCCEQSRAERPNNAEASNAHAVPRDFTRYTPKDFTRYT